MAANFNKYIEFIFSHPLFENLDQSHKDLLANSIKFKRISAGTQLTIDNEISSDIIISINGDIRPVVQLNQKLISHSKQGPGCIVGLASILNMRHCEDCISTQDMDIGIIDENVFLQLYTHCKSVKDWCDHHLWPQEVMQVVSDLVSRHPKHVNITPKILDEVVKSSILVASSKASITDALKSGFQLHTASGMTNVVAGSQIDTKSIPVSSSNLSVRIVGIRPEIIGINSIQQVENINHLDEERDLIASKINDEMEFSPARSRFESQGSIPHNFKLYRGKGDINEAIACIRMITNILDLPFRKDAILSVLQQAFDSSKEINLRLIGDIFSGMNLLVNCISSNHKYLLRASVPSLLRIDNEMVVLVSSSQNNVVLASPLRGVLRYNSNDLKHIFSENVTIISFEKKYSTPSKKFGLSWFFPLLKKYKQFVAQTFLSSFVIQLLILCNPLIVQVVIDKVINQKSLDSLQILGVALLAITIIEGILSGFKTFIFTDTTNKIDQRLGAEVFDHLLRLPLSYFDKRPVGDLSSRLAELQKIRDFLLGQGLTTLLDAIFCIIYIVIMLLYSLKLTLIALAVVPIQISLTLIGAPIYRRLLRNTTQANAKNQSFIVEVLTGIGTVKSQNIELQSRLNWQDLYGTYINRSFEKTIVGTFVVQCSQTLQKLSQLLVLWIGALLVLDGQLTLGQLIAFRIISGYVTQPLLRISGFWQNIQELNISLDRLSDIVDHKSESTADSADMLQMPLIHGKILLQSVSFRFPESPSLAINEVNINIEPGMFVAIVGHSGSGKSTLVKLISRLYLPTSGKILIDDYDINKVELYSLRRQLGLVSQEPLLFAGTVRENIAVAAPNATESQIVNAAKFAHAHDFIQDLPAGYSSLVGERGSSLSGGQRQRLSIARTLLTMPRMLIFDEATSALDYPTEKIICQNLSDNFSETTTLFVTHRIESIQHADLIMVMEKGTLKEYGTHADLMSLGKTYYSLCQSSQELV